MEIIIKKESSPENATIIFLLWIKWILSWIIIVQKDEKNEWSIFILFEGDFTNELINKIILK